MERILKGLECCTGAPGCVECPYQPNSECMAELISDCYDIIQQQNKFIEHLQKICDNYFTEILEGK